MANDAPGLIHAVLGELSLDRITYLVSEPSLQRTFELKLFRPFVLPWVCSLKPAFVSALLRVFRHAIAGQMGAQHVGGELYLRFLLFRIVEELRCVGDLSHIRAAYASIEEDPRLQLSSRLLPLIERLLTVRDSSSSTQQGIQLYQESICQTYLMWMHAKHGDQLRATDPMTPVLLVSFAIYRASTNGLGPTKVDKYTCQRLEDWIVALFQTWKPLLVVNGTPTDLLAKILLPFARYFTQTERPELTQGLETAKWRCEGPYPTFVTLLNGTTLTVEASSGLFFVNQVMQAFVSYEHASHDTYQRYFGSLILRGSLRQKDGWSVYRCHLYNKVTQEQDEYIIKAHVGELFVFRQIGKANRWYQFLPQGLPSINSPTPEEAFPAFIRDSDTWIRQRAVWWKYTIYCSTRSRDPQQSVVHHGIKCYATEKGVATCKSIKRFPSCEVVHYLPPATIPAAIRSFEHPWFIEFADRNLYFPRFGLSFTRRGATRPWLSNDFPGYVLSDDSSVDPFHDRSAYWLTLERRRSFGHVSYLLVAGCFPLLPHPPSSQEGDVQWSCVRRGTRAVWIDHQVSTVTEAPFITLRVDEEYPSLLHTSSSGGHCWLVLLYLAKRDYYNCLLLIAQISFDTQLVPEQLVQLHRVLRWHDNSANGCVVKLKIIAALARSDPNLICSAESSQKRNALPQLPQLPHGDKKPAGRFTESLLGLTQEEFFDFYLTAATTRGSSPFPMAPTMASPVRAAAISLTPMEWQYIDRALDRWPSGVALRGLHYNRMRSLTAPQWQSSWERASAVYAAACSEELGVPLLDVAYDILQEYHSSVGASLALVTPLCLGRPSRRWSEYFVSIHRHLLRLPPHSDELKQWIFLLGCEPYCGDRLARRCRVLLYRVAVAVQNQIPIQEFPRKMHGHRTAMAKRLGVQAFGLRKNKDREYLHAIEGILRSVELVTQTPPDTILSDALPDQPASSSPLDSLPDSMKDGQMPPQDLMSLMNKFAAEGSSQPMPRVDEEDEDEGQSQWDYAQTSIERVMETFGMNSPIDPSTVHCPQEIRALERTLAQRLNRSQARGPPFYDLVSESLPALSPLVDVCFQIQVNSREEKVWNAYSECLFGQQHYEQLHHQESARGMREGFDRAWKDSAMVITFRPSEEQTVLRLKGELYRIRASLEQQQKPLVQTIYELLQPALIEGSPVCATQAVPLQAILNAWETNRLSRLQCYGCRKLEPEAGHRLHQAVEALDVLICWRQHIANIIHKLEQTASCTQPQERAALLTDLYNLFHESLCYQVSDPPTPPQNRKILAISRTNGFLARPRQVKLVNTLLENPNQAIQAALGLGKSSVIVPLLASALADRAHSVWIMCPLTDKPETVQRCEHVRKTLNHPLLLFHFDNDGTHLAPPVEDEPEHLGEEIPTRTEEQPTMQTLLPPYRLDSVVHVRELYYDLLLTISEGGLVITTRESLLYFVDTYEQLWISRAHHARAKDAEAMNKCDMLLYWMSKFFPIFKQHGRAIMDEIDVVLKSNVKVNVALSDMAKINRDTLSLAVQAVQLLMDPHETVEFVDPSCGPVCCPILEVLPLVHNCQAATPLSIKQLLRTTVAERLGAKLFGFVPEHPDRQAYLAFVLCHDPHLGEQFYQHFIQDEGCTHEQAANIVRLRELLGGSFATLFKRHNYALGRMFTNANRDDVGPYSAANQPLKNSHLSSEYDWVWALAANYAMVGITRQQLVRYLNQEREEILASRINTSNDEFLVCTPSSSRTNERATHFEETFGLSILDVRETMLPSLLERINDLGPWATLMVQKVEAARRYVMSATPDVQEKMRNEVPDLFLEHISVHRVPSLARRLFRVTRAQYEWPQVLQAVETDKQCGQVMEQTFMKRFVEGIESRLSFLTRFINLTYYPSFIEGNAATLVHIFGSVCGFSGTMEAPHTLPQSVFCQSDPALLRDRAIDGIVLSRFLSYALESGSEDTTQFVDDAALCALSRIHSGAIPPEALVNRTREILLACYDAQAIVDGGALLDVEPQQVIHQLAEDQELRRVMSDPDKPPVRVVRWKEGGHWTLLDLSSQHKQQQQHRTEPLDLNTLLTFYDQEHSRGTDAKLAPDAMMINTVGDETSLTEWSQSEGRARQSGKGQTSRSIIAPHIRFQLTGQGPLAIRMLRVLIQRSSNSEVSEAFYAHAEQVRCYLRDAIRSGMAEYLATSPSPPEERTAMADLVQELFQRRCDVDLTDRSVLLHSAQPQQYTNSSKCLHMVIQQEAALMEQWISRLRTCPSLSPTCKAALCRAVAKAQQALDAHVVPPTAALPAGEVGIPRPGEQSFGIVLSTEVAQEQMVEVETELDLESEVSLAHRGQDLEDLRPPWKDWDPSWYESPLHLWHAVGLESLFVSLAMYFPHLYQHARVSTNLGMWVDSYTPPCTATQEADFYWLHDAFIDPFVYHVLIDHPQEGTRCLTLAHQEYSQYLSPLLRQGWDATQPRISVYRYGSYGWVAFDTTISPDLRPLPADGTTPSAQRALAEWTLLSGHVDIGSPAEQLRFLQLFLEYGDARTAIMDWVGHRKEAFFPASVRESLAPLQALMAALSPFSADNSLSSVLEIAPLPELTAVASRLHEQCTVGELISRLEWEMDYFVGKHVVRSILTPEVEEAWASLLCHLFGSPDSQERILSATQQIRVIANRHRAGRAKSLAHSPMWRLSRALRRLCEANREQV